MEKTLVRKLGCVIDNDNLVYYGGFVIRMNTNTSRILRLTAPSATLQIIGDVTFPNGEKKAPLVNGMTLPDGNYDLIVFDDYKATKIQLGTERSMYESTLYNFDTLRYRENLVELDLRKVNAVGNATMFEAGHIPHLEYLYTHRLVGSIEEFAEARFMNGYVGECWVNSNGTANVAHTWHGVKVVGNTDNYLCVISASNILVYKNNRSTLVGKYEDGEWIYY